ncbi:E3 ubiquitin-protein ligase ATL6 [Platanthera guangdongensis]|uniref:RING-type E3 ubiquitin transferase n=1 Tax=Platanthera guangdongensis TaxID=2320717 RepID=A0ABR2N3S4_9ASPA
MAENHSRRRIAVLQLFLIIILIGRRVESQPQSTASTNSTGNNNNTGQQFAGHFNPYTVVIIVVLISAFFILGFFSIYIRQCGGAPQDSFNASAFTAAAAARLRLQHGLDREVLESIPTLVYSEVKEHKIGKGALECAICLNEFEDDETIRLLTKCDHVFHQECIDAWLDTHVTCPVCRTNYTDFSSADFTPKIPAGNDGASVADAPSQAAVISDPLAADHVAISVDDVEERKEEMRELARIASRVRGNGARRSKRFQRSHSAGQIMMPKGEAGVDRYTLRLPENVRNEIIAAGKLKRAKTFAVICADDTNMRRISRGGGEGSSLRGQTIRLGKSERWPSFFGRSLSAKIPAWSSRKKMDEGSMSRKFSGVKSKVDFRGGAVAVADGSKTNANNHSNELSTAPLYRV